MALKRRSVGAARRHRDLRLHDPDEADLHRLCFGQVLNDLVLGTAHRIRPPCESGSTAAGTGARRIAGDSKARAYTEGLPGHAIANATEVRLRATGLTRLALAPAAARDRH